MKSSHFGWLSALTICARRVGAHTEPPLVSHAGTSAIIPGWDLQSTAKVGDDLVLLSRFGFDSSSWHHIGSRATVVGGLIEAGVYNTSHLFYSNNLETSVDHSQFTIPWIYRQEFILHPGAGQHFSLKTNGITSKADIYLNGHLVADRATQVGAYGGKTYDVTSLVEYSNALVIKPYQTDYNFDFALGFVDWNPYPPDNGTGVWRDVEIKQTGPLALGIPRVINDFDGTDNKHVTVKIKVEVQNLENNTIDATLEGQVEGVDGKVCKVVQQTICLAPKQTTMVELTATINDAEIWWPKQWGAQPLYYTQLTLRIDDTVSDTSKKQAFGIRHVTSHVNMHNDTIFEVNRRPFEVFGGGYSADLFLRWDETKFETQMQYMLDMGLNTVRLEGKQEHPELYDYADRVGLMVIAGWECCDKWEGWDYNTDIAPSIWSDADYQTANSSMKHEVEMMQSHPSILAFLVGSDWWPNDRAAAIYVEILQEGDWQNPIICSAAKRGYPEILGPSGMKMDGPYDWVPPIYWYGDQFGAAFGFGSELGSGVGTPEIGSLKKFLSKEDLDDLWQQPNMNLYHMGTNVSQFPNRTIYNDALFARYGQPTSLENYLLKAQMMDYEATRVEFESFAAKWNAERPATGAIYWMLNNAWPSLHWNQFDYYLHPGGSYFGTKVGCRMEHVAYDYAQKTIYLINRSLVASGNRIVEAQLIDRTGKVIGAKRITVKTTPNTSFQILDVPGVEKIEDVSFLRLVLTDPRQGNKVLSRNIYWLSRAQDELDWVNSTWYYTPTTSYSDFTALSKLGQANVDVRTSQSAVVLENRSDIPALFLRLNLVDENGEDVIPVTWEDNYCTLFPGEKLEISFGHQRKSKGLRIEISGYNIASRTAGV